MKKRNIKESVIKASARRMLYEGEMENAESALAAKDLVDRLQDMVQELGKMSNDELPHLVSSMRSSFGPDKARAYETSANDVINNLLTNVKTGKADLENATLVLTGDADPNSINDLKLPPDSRGGMGLSTEPEDETIEVDKKITRPKNPLGRESRITTEAKITAITAALKNTDMKKQPLRARRLYEELRSLVNESVKAESIRVSKRKK